MKRTFKNVQDGDLLWEPSAGHKLLVTHFDIEATGDKPAVMQLWFGSLPPYRRGTDFALFDGELAQGIRQSGEWCGQIGQALRVNKSEKIPLSVTVWASEVPPLTH